MALLENGADRVRELTLAIVAEVVRPAIAYYRGYPEQR